MQVRLPQRNPKFFAKRGLILLLSLVLALSNFMFAAATEEAEASSVQIVKKGGENRSADGNVSVSKTIEKTELENIFDITLQVKTKEKLSELSQKPDMAVVVVMDISNTMTYAFGSTNRAEVGSRKYDAAMESAATFIDSFAANASDSSQIGYVAFNTDAHQIMQLRSCSAGDADIVKKQIQTETNKALKLIENNESKERFTNIEAGLKMAEDMLTGAPAQIEDRYIIFLSDGFPTTYIENDYKGYDPYCTSGEPGSDGVFYDSITKKYCDYGTSYSDKAAIRSRQAAESIKAKGIKIFSIGIDIGGQTIEKFVETL